MQIKYRSFGFAGLRTLSGIHKRFIFFHMYIKSCITNSETYACIKLVRVKIKLSRVPFSIETSCILFSSVRPCLEFNFLVRTKYFIALNCQNGEESVKERNKFMDKHLLCDSFLLFKHIYRVFPLLLVAKERFGR